MKLLIVTQTVDSRDPVLGFFVSWIRKLAPEYEKVTVFALRVGERELPKNVSVIPLHRGKKVPGQGRALVVNRFLSLVVSERKNYDAVLVHMNEEYVLLAGVLWRMFGKRVYLWRNHYAGTWRTAWAARLSDKVFYTSKNSYTARFKNAVQMPVGVDIARFTQPGPEERTQKSVLFLSRIAPAKRPEWLIDATHLLLEEGATMHTTIAGSPLTEHTDYACSLLTLVKEYGISHAVTFVPGTPNAETPHLYRAHDIFVNCSPSGMYDKVLFEAAAAGCVVLAASADWNALMGTQGFASPEELAERLREVLHFSESEREGRIALQREKIASHTLDALATSLKREIK